MQTNRKAGHSKKEQGTMRISKHKAKTHTCREEKESEGEEGEMSAGTAE